jgi:hypothetical protein
MIFLTRQQKPDLFTSDKHVALVEPLNAEISSVRALRFGLVGVAAKSSKSPTSWLFRVSPSLIFSNGGAGSAAVAGVTTTSSKGPLLLLLLAVENELLAL